MPRAEVKRRLAPGRQNQVTLLTREHHVELVPRHAFDLLIALEPLDSGFELLIFAFEGIEFIDCAIQLVPLVDVAACRKDTKDKHREDHQSEQCPRHKLRESSQNWSWFVRESR